MASGTLVGVATELGDLIVDVERTNGGWSDREVCRQAERQGHNLTPTDVYNYRHQGMKTLVPAKVIGLAAGLQIPPHRVAAAVLADLGIPIPRWDVTPEQAIAQDISLPAHDRRRLLGMLEQARADSGR